MHRRFLSSRRLFASAGAVALTTGLSLGIAAGAAPVALAADNCQAYATQTGCPSVAPTTISSPQVKGTTLTKAPEASSLPFTGGEFVLLASAGVIALGAGSVLVAASKRRRSTPAA